MDGGGRHLPLPPQLQRGPPDLLGLHQRIRLQAQVNMGQNHQIGWLSTELLSISHLYLRLRNPSLSLFSTSSQTKQTIEKLQHLVSADGRFRTLRDALHRTDPPCIPFLGRGFSMPSVIRPLQQDSCRFHPLLSSLKIQHIQSMLGCLVFDKRSAAQPKIPCVGIASVQKYAYCVYSSTCLVSTK